MKKRVFSGVLLCLAVMQLAVQYPALVISQDVTVDSTVSITTVTATADLASLSQRDGLAVLIKTGANAGLWRYSKTSTATVDDTTVLNGPGSVGRFLQITIAPGAGSLDVLHDLTGKTAADLDPDATIEFVYYDVNEGTSYKVPLDELRKKGDVSTVANVAALFTATHARDNQLFQTLGYSTEGIGANLYRYDASSTATIDGGFVQPGIGGVLSFSGTTFNGTAGTGRFIAVDQTIADVTKFGEAADDATDDRSAIQRALNSGAKTVVLQGGRTRLVGSTLNVPAGVSLIGNGKSAVLHMSAISDLLSLASNTVIENVTLTGPGNATYQSGSVAIAIRGTVGTRITDVKIANVVVDGFAQYAVYGEFCSNTVVARSTISDISYAGVMILSGDTCEVSDCRISNITPGTSSNAYGVAFTMNNASTDLNVTPRSIHCKAVRNIITDIEIWEALDTHGGDDILFDSNEIRNCKHGIVAGKTGANVGALLVNAKNNNITVNKNGYGIVFANYWSGSTYVSGSISGNTIKEAGLDGVSNNLGAVHIEMTRGVRITDNLILDAAGHGIVLYHKNIGALISKNSIVDPQTPDSVLWDVACVAVRGTINSAIIDGNAFIRSGNISGKKVAVCGFLMDTTSGCEITMGQNFNSCTLPLAGTLASVVRHGRFFGQAGKFVGTGAPAFAAARGSEYTNVSGSTGNVFYINENGTSGGWVAK